MPCSEPGPAAAVQAPAYVAPPGKAAITAVKYAAGQVDSSVPALIYLGDSAPPEQTPAKVIRTGQQLNPTVTIKNVGGTGALIYVRGFIFIDVSACTLPAHFYMSAQQYKKSVCEDYWLCDYTVQLCFDEVNVFLNPGQEVTANFLSQPLPAINSLRGVMWEAGRIVNGEYTPDLWFNHQASVQYQP